MGSLYAGVDDFEWWTPKEAGRFTLDVEEYGIHREGSWDEALLFPERMEVKDWFNGNPYTLYSGGDYPWPLSSTITTRRGRTWCSSGTPWPAP